MQLQPNFKLSDGDYKVWQFPSGEIQVQLLSPSIIYFTEHRPSWFEITGSVLSSDHLMELLLLVDAIRSSATEPFNLYLDMPYCAYSRQDRVCNNGESFSLKVFTDLINSCNFTSVTTYDNHSDVSTALINNCKNMSVSDILGNHTNHKLTVLPNTLQVNNYDYFISPDAGANKKVFACSQRFNTPMIRADKVRDTTTGNILSTEVYATSDQLQNATVLIVDDIAANGMTFYYLAKTIKEIEPTCKIHLYVTHGFFHSGLDKLSEYIDHFITTDSVCKIQADNLTLINL